MRYALLSNVLPLMIFYPCKDKVSEIIFEVLDFRSR